MTEPAVGASTCASGSHVWNGEHRDLDGEHQEERTEREELELVPSKPKPRSCSKSKAPAHEPVAAWKLERRGQDGDQHRDRPDERVEDELDGRVDAVRATQVVPIIRYIGTSTTSQRL